MILDGKVALITGAGSGIGADSARLFAREGAKVGILSRTTEEVTQVADTIRSSGGETLPLTADISKPQEIQSAINRLVERWGRLDIVFANAGINGVWAPLDELSVEDWERTIRINLTGTFLTLKYSFPYMKENGGAMLVTSSVNGTRIFSNTGATAYSATKAAQVAVTKMLAVELAKNRIRVNVICPGAIKT